MSRPTSGPWSKDNVPPIGHPQGSWTVTGPLAFRNGVAHVPAVCACKRIKRWIRISDFNAGKVTKCRLCNQDDQRKHFKYGRATASHGDGR